MFVERRPESLERKQGPSGLQPSARDIALVPGSWSEVDAGFTSSLMSVILKPWGGGEKERRAVAPKNAGSPLFTLLLQDSRQLPAIANVLRYDRISPDSRNSMAVPGISKESTCPPSRLRGVRGCRAFTLDNHQMSRTPRTCKNSVIMASRGFCAPTLSDWPSML